MLTRRQYVTLRRALLREASLFDRTVLSILADLAQIRRNPRALLQRHLYGAAKLMRPKETA